MSGRLIALLFLAASLCTAQRRVIFPAGAKPIGPYSPGILAGDFLYVSGQGPRDRSAAAGEQVRQTLDNIRSIVEAAGLTMDHLVYTQVYLHSSVSFEQMNAAWREYFPKNPPARAVLGVHRLPTDILVEINAVAFRDLSRRKPVNPAGVAVNPAAPQAVLAGKRLYLSGVLGRDPSSDKIPEDPAAQVQLALDRMKQNLGAAGLNFSHMVFVNPYLTKQMPANVMNKIYAQQFEFGNTPARATIQVSHLPYGANIEFTGVAIADPQKRLAVRPENMAPSPTASPCVWADDTLYCSAKAGFIPGPNGGIYAESVEDQVRQTMRNLLDGLEEAGLDFSHVVASNVYLDNLDEFTKMNGVYGRYFPAASPPTRTTVAPLPPVERIRSASGHSPKLEEISVIAVK